MSKLLADRLALISGGGSSVGKATSIIFAREGAKVIIADIDWYAAETTLKDMPDSSNHQAKFVDVTQSSSVQELFDEIKTESGIPDILVNCADIVRDSFTLNTTETFDDVIAANLKGTYLLTQAASQLMIDDNITNGSIINIGSLSGEVGNKGQCNYSASKAGVESFTKAVAKELGRKGIRCNAIMPRFNDTPMSSGPSDEVEVLELKLIPMKRFCQPAEVAEVCAFLASNRSSCMNGCIIEVSGGFY